MVRMAHSTSLPSSRAVSYTHLKQQSEKLMESEKKRLTELTERLEKGNERGKRILKYINPEFLTKEIVEELIDHIVVGKKSKETGEIPVEIHWNF